VTLWQHVPQHLAVDRDRGAGPRAQEKFPVVSAPALILVQSPHPTGQLIVEEHDSAGVLLEHEGERFHGGVASLETPADRLLRLLRERDRMIGIRLRVGPGLLPGGERSLVPEHRSLVFLHPPLVVAHKTGRLLMHRAGHRIERWRLLIAGMAHERRIDHRDLVPRPLRRDLAARTDQAAGDRHHAEPHEVERAWHRRRDCLTVPGDRRGENVDGKRIHPIVDGRPRGLAILLPRPPSPLIWPALRRRIIARSSHDQTERILPPLPAAPAQPGLSPRQDDRYFGDLRACYTHRDALLVRTGGGVCDRVAGPPAWELGGLTFSSERPLSGSLALCLSPPARPAGIGDPLSPRRSARRCAAESETRCLGLMSASRSATRTSTRCELTSKTWRRPRSRQRRRVRSLTRTWRAPSWSVNHAG